MELQWKFGGVEKPCVRTHGSTMRATGRPPQRGKLRACATLHPAHPTIIRAEKLPAPGPSPGVVLHE